MAHHVQSLIEHYGYFGIIVILIGGIVGVPLPDEVFLTYVGYSVYRESLEHIPALVSAMIGAVGGITLSYYIGYRFGLPLLQKYGPKIHITEQKLTLRKDVYKNRTYPIINWLFYPRGTPFDSVYCGY